MPSPAQDDDRRAEHRRRAFLNAMVILDSRMSTFAVTVRNQSGEGFLLDAGDTTMIPNEFSLKLPEDAVEYRCAVTRRTSGFLGVKVIARNGPAAK
ncbi:unnamed protein product, partial [Ectocarpus sp. 12 AP-2014]